MTAPQQPGPGDRPSSGGGQQYTPSDQSESSRPGAEPGRHSADRPGDTPSRGMPTDVSRPEPTQVIPSALDPRSGERPGGYPPPAGGGYPPPPPGGGYPPPPGAGYGGPPPAGGPPNWPSAEPPRAQQPGGYPGGGYPGQQPGGYQGQPQPGGYPGYGPPQGGQPGGYPPPPPQQPGPYGGAPYGQPPGQYGPPPQQQWGGQPQQYGQYGAPGGYPGYGPQPAVRSDLAEWGQRAIGGLIDYVAPFVAAVILAILFGAVLSSGLAGLLTFLVYLGALGFVLWNSYQGGETGQTIGRKYAKIKLIKEDTGQPVGGGMGVLRYLVHAIEFGIGWFAPLFTPKKQTFADMVLGTVVVRADD